MAGRRKNRRIEIVVEPLLAEMPQLPEELEPKAAQGGAPAP